MAFTLIWNTDVAITMATDERPARLAVELFTGYRMHRQLLLEKTKAYQKCHIFAVLARRNYCTAMTVMYFS